MWRCRHREGGAGAIGSEPTSASTVVNPYDGDSPIALGMRESDGKSDRVALLAAQFCLGHLRSTDHAPLGFGPRRAGRSFSRSEFSAASAAFTSCLLFLLQPLPPPTDSWRSAYPLFSPRLSPRRASPPRSLSNQPPCPTRWRAETCSAVVARARARPTRSRFRSSSGSPAAAQSAVLGAHEH